MPSFCHLQNINQTFHGHFHDAMSYGWLSLQSSFFFIVHACYPDLFVWNGSTTIHKLSSLLHEKHVKLN